MVASSVSKIGLKGSKIYYKARVESLDFRRVDICLTRAPRDRPFIRSRPNSCSMNTMLDIDEKNQASLQWGG